MYDEIINKLNRLPRPAFAFCAIFFLAYGTFFPERLERTAEAFQALPPTFFGIIITIVGGFFGGRTLGKIFEKPEKVKPIATWTDKKDLISDRDTKQDARYWVDSTKRVPLKPLNEVLANAKTRS